MSKKIKLRAKKAMKRAIRAHRKYTKNHYKDTVDYAIERLVKEWYPEGRKV